MARQRTLLMISSPSSPFWRDLIGAPKNFTEFELVCRGVFKKITFFDSLAKNSPQDCFLNARLRVPFGAT